LERTVAYPQAWNSNGAVAIPKDGTPTWLPVVPLGKFHLQVKNPKTGQYETVEVDIKREWLDEMVANFKDGFPTSLGVPANERADHSTNPDGAYAYYADLKFDEQGEYGPGVYGLFAPTEYGKPVIAAGNMPYTSPRYTVGDLPDPNWGRRNILIAAALTPLPQHSGQPHMILASAQFEEATAAVAATDTSDEGVMAMTPEELQAKIDEAVAAAKATWDQDKADALAAVEQEKTDLQAQVATLTEKAGDYDNLKAQVELLVADAEKTKAQARYEEAKRELEAVRIPVPRALPDGTVQTDLRAYAPEYVEVAASFRVDSGDPQKAAAYWPLAAAPPTVPAPEGDKPALHVAASAPADTAGMSEEQKLAAAVAAGEVIPGTEDHAAIVRHMESGLTLSGARHQLARATAGLPG
jgi:hypothetical protein